MSSQSGAKQWRLNCEHKAGRPSDRAMHSEVSKSNVGYFPEEDRVVDEVDQSDLVAWLERADALDGHLVVCCHCRRVKILADGDLTVVHEGGERS